MLVGAAQCLAKQAVIGAVAGVSGAMAPYNLASPCEHERAAELVPVLFGFGLGPIAALCLAVQADALGAAARHALRRESKDLPQ